MKTYTVTFTSGLVHSHGATQYRYAPNTTHPDVPQLIVDVLRSISGRTDVITENRPPESRASESRAPKPSAPSPADRDDA